MPAGAALAELLADLAEEQRALDDVVAAMAPEGWDRPTPAAGWAVRDQISHLAFFDDAATTAIVEPERFVAQAEAAIAAMASGDDPMAAHLTKGRAMQGDGLLAWWRQARAGLLAAAPSLEPGTRVPWYGPAMSAMSFVSARLMETWAHGQDVCNALGVDRPATRRLKHVAHVGVRARPFSFAVRGLPAPTEAVEVVLTGPGGERWEWDVPAASSVHGDALDFCLVVTQRRHLADTALVVEGTAAHDWMAIAQAFAGPPGPGRPPRRSG
jgi:uncharacterized protein (TIGR03084 family)